MATETEKEALHAERKLATLKEEIKQAQQEKAELLKLITPEKLRVFEAEKQLHSAERKQFNESKQIIADLKAELSNKQVVEQLVNLDLHSVVFLNKFEVGALANKREFSISDGSVESINATMVNGSYSHVNITMRTGVEYIVPWSSVALIQRNNEASKLRALKRRIS